MRLTSLIFLILCVCIMASLAVPAHAVVIGSFGDYVGVFKSSYDLGYNPGGIGFDSTGQIMYFTKDYQNDTDGRGLYALTYATDFMSATLSDNLALNAPGLGNDYRNPQGVLVDANDDVYVVYDYTPALRKVTDPMGAATESDVFFGLDVLGGTGDDDPYDMVFAPPGFSGPNVAPGDIILTDNGLDGNYDEAIEVVTPAGAATVLTSWTTLPNDPGDGNLQNIAADNINSKVYLLPNDMTVDNGTHFFSLSSDGTLNEHWVTMPDGISFDNVQGMDVHPVDGSIWFADDNIDDVWRIDPSTLTVTLEIDFIADPETETGLPNFNYNAMAFTPDGRHLIIGDIENVSAHPNSYLVFGIVPEPASWLLLAVGALVMLGSRRRR